MLTFYVKYYILYPCQKGLILFRRWISLDPLKVELEQGVKRVNPTYRQLKNAGGFKAGDYVFCYKSNPILNHPLIDERPTYGVKVANIEQVILAALASTEVDVYLDTGDPYPIVIHIDFAWLPHITLLPESYWSEADNEAEEESKK